jgi:hypothetical protein
MTTGGQHDAPTGAISVGMAISQARCAYRFEIARCKILPRLAGHVWEPSSESFSLSAIRAKSGREEAFIFRMTCPR